MAFKLANSETFWFNVKAVQITDAGKTVENNIMFQFKRLDIDERRERDLRLGGDIFQQVMAETDGDQEKLSGKFTAELVKQGRMNKSADELTDELLEIVTGWKDVEDTNGPLAFNRDNLLLLVKVVPNLPAAINDAYRLAYSGELKRGN
jgi:hypothetical protein